MLPIKEDIIANAEKEMLALPQAECPVIHKFENGYYIRELHMKAGTLAIGHHQNFEHLNVFLQGKVQIRNEDGTSTILKAPMVFIGKPGRKIGYVLEDLIWQNVYLTELKDVDLLEALLLTKSPEAIQHTFNKYVDDFGANETERLHYKETIKQLGFTEEEVQSQVQNETDQIEMPDGAYKFKVGISAIHGKGIIATCDIRKDEAIGIARLGAFRTPLGRYTNHSSKPNAVMMNIYENYVLVATRDIKGATGQDSGEEIVIDYGAAVNLVRQLEG